MSVPLPELQKFIAGLPDWAFDEVYKLGLPVLGLPYEVNDNSVTFSKVFEVRKDGSFSAFSENVDGEEFSRLAALASFLGVDVAKGAVDTELHLVESGIVKCGWLKTIVDRGLGYKYTLGGKYKVENFCPIDETPYDGVTYIASGDNIFGVETSVGDVSVEYFLSRDYYIMYRGSKVTQGSVKVVPENVEDAAVTVRKIPKVVEVEGSYVYVFGKCAAITTDKYFIGGLEFVEDYSEILNKIDDRLVDNGWTFYREIVEFQPYEYYKKKFGNIALIMTVDKGLPSQTVIMTPINYARVTLPYSGPLIDGMDLRDYLRALPMF